MAGNHSQLFTSKWLLEYRTCAESCGKLREGLRYQEVRESSTCGLHKGIFYSSLENTTSTLHDIIIIPAFCVRPFLYISYLLWYLAFTCRLGEPFPWSLLTTLLGEGHCVYSTPLRHFPVVVLYIQVPSPELPYHHPYVDGWSSLQQKTSVHEMSINQLMNIQDCMFQYNIIQKFV